MPVRTKPLALVGALDSHRIGAHPDPAGIMKLDALANVRPPARISTVTNPGWSLRRPHQQKVAGAVVIVGTGDESGGLE